jgi:hypothetical protein
MSDQQQTPQTAQIAQAIQEVSDRAQILVREEIELAKAEVTAKVTKLAKGAAVGVAAGVFGVIAVLFLLHALAWFAWWALPVGDSQIFWGFLFVAALFLALGALAGYLAARWLKGGSPPTPQMAIDEAKLIRETFEGPGDKA